MKTNKQTKHPKHTFPKTGEERKNIQTFDKALLVHVLEKHVNKLTPGQQEIGLSVTMRLWLVNFGLCQQR